MKQGFIVLILIGIWYSCQCDKTKQLYLIKGLDESGCPKVDSTTVFIPTSKIDRINVFLETSGSMAGYMPKQKPATNFQKTIIDILSKLDSKFSYSVNFYYMADQNTSFKKISYSKAQDDILKGDFDWRGSTDIPVILDSVNNYLNDNAINILISDLIYSPEEKGSNKTDVASSEIFRRVNPYKKYSSSFICLFSEYRSSICADNNPTDKSPYYLLVQGKAENIRIIEPVLYESINRSDSVYNEINFGLNYKMPYYSVLPYTETTSNFIANSCTSFRDAFVSIQDIKFENNENKIEFWLGLYLNDFPEYSKTNEYLTQNLKIQLDNGEYEIMAIEKLPYSSVVTDDDYITQKCTHLVKLKISNLSEYVSILFLSLECTLPIWYKTMNENTSENNREKTFGLEKIISGFEQSYCPNQNEYFFQNLPISLIKE